MIVPMRYRSGYRYQVQYDWSWPLGSRVGKLIETAYIRLESNGELELKRGYAWDGASWFPDFWWMIVPSAIHDALYQLIREGLLPPTWREDADLELYRAIKRQWDDGEKRGWLSRKLIGVWSELLAMIVFAGVRFFADPAADPAHRRPVLEAPKRKRRI